MVRRVVSINKRMTLSCFEVPVKVEQIKDRLFSYRPTIQVKKKNIAISGVVVND